VSAVTQRVVLLLATQSALRFVARNKNKNRQKHLQHPAHFHFHFFALQPFLRIFFLALSWYLSSKPKYLSICPQCGRRVVYRDHMLCRINKPRAGPKQIKTKSKNKKWRKSIYAAVLYATIQIAAFFLTCTITTTITNNNDRREVKTPKGNAIHLSTYTRSLPAAV
jgi:hypothetical protein